MTQPCGSISENYGWSRRRLWRLCTTMGYPQDSLTRAYGHPRGRYKPASHPLFPQGPPVLVSGSPYHQVMAKTRNPAAPTAAHDDLAESVVAAITAAWCGETSAREDWTPGRRSAGQCAVTALLVQDLLGGELLRGVVCGESHYWNRLPDGSQVDLTSDQFNEYRLEDGPVVRDREYVLSFPVTAERYDKLRATVEGHLNGLLATAAKVRGQGIRRRPVLYERHGEAR